MKRRKYISDIDARTMGLHALGAQDNGGRKINPAHMLKLLEKLLAADRGARVNVNRNLLADCLALVEAIARTADKTGAGGSDE